MLLNRKNFSNKYPGIIEGTTVYCRDGEKLGIISSFADDSLSVKKGVFFPKDFTFRYDDIDEIRDDAVYLNLTTDELKDWQNPSYSGWGKVTDVNTETINVPLFEEELEAKKVSHQTGEIRVRKIVHTELRHLTVPLAHEEVRIERVKMETRSPLREEESREAFTDRTVSVKVMDEEVEISKHPVMREELRITKDRRIEQRDVSENIRSEDVEIENNKEAFEQERKAG